MSNELLSASFSGVSTRTEEKVQILEKEMLKMPQAACPVKHIFGPSIYIRQVTIEADVFSIGHYQNEEHLNIMLAGRVTMVNEDGSHTELTAPQTFTSKPGRKIGYIHEQMVWQNVYSTDETNIEKLEERFLTKSVSWQDQIKINNLLLTNSTSEDITDYFQVLEEFGFNHDDVLVQVLNTEDQIEMPYGSWGFSLASSNIEGKGIFAASSFLEGDIVGPARIAGMRTPLGRYTNHAKEPNAKMVLKDNGDIDLVMLKPITGNMGGVSGEEITVDYRQVLKLSLV